MGPPTYNEWAWCCVEDIRGLSGARYSLRVSPLFTEVIIGVRGMVGERIGAELVPRGVEGDESPTRGMISLLSTNQNVVLTELAIRMGRGSVKEQ